MWYTTIYSIAFIIYVGYIAHKIAMYNELWSTIYNYVQDISITNLWIYCTIYDAFDFEFDTTYGFYTIIFELSF